MAFVNLHREELLDEELFDARNPLAACSGKVVFDLEARVLLEIPDIKARLQTLRELGFNFALEIAQADLETMAQLYEIRPAFARVILDPVRHAGAGHQRLAALVNEVMTLGIEVVLSRLETPEQFEAACLLRCQLAQGYLFGQPG
jgi:EAL domain-containing protein (putative c-di-GMP-specific phosphodiesterase class I)